jgi:hypothetical protein
VVAFSLQTPPLKIYKTNNDRFALAATQGSATPESVQQGRKIGRLITKTSSSAQQRESLTTGTQSFLHSLSSTGEYQEGASIEPSLWEHMTTIPESVHLSSFLRLPPLLKHRHLLSSSAQNHILIHINLLKNSSTSPSIPNQSISCPSISLSVYLLIRSISS